MYIHIRVGVREGKSGRPPKKLRVDRFEAAESGDAFVLAFMGGSGTKAYWSLRAAFAPGCFDRLAAFVLDPARFRRASVAVAVEGPRHTVRAVRPNVTRRLYADGLEVHKHVDAIVARWHDGSTCFEMVADADGWCNLFTEVREKTGRGPVITLRNDGPRLSCEHGTEGGLCGTCRRAQPAAARKAVLDLLKPQKPAPARPTPAAAAFDLDMLIPAANADRSEPCSGAGPHAHAAQVGTSVAQVGTPDE